MQKNKRQKLVIANQGSKSIPPPLEIVKGISKYFWFAEYDRGRNTVESVLYIQIIQLVGQTHDGIEDNRTSTEQQKQLYNTQFQHQCGAQK